MARRGSSARVGKKLSNKLPPFVPMVWGMLNSEAYKHLPASAGKALPYFIGKVKCSFNYSGRYYIDFKFSYSEGIKVGFALATFSGVIRDLVSFGFIDPVDKGGLRSEGKSNNQFRLSRRWENYGTESFEPLDWSCFIPKPR